jgi:hypothetical protein
MMNQYHHAAPRSWMLASPSKRDRSRSNREFVARQPREGRLKIKSIGERFQCRLEREGFSATLHHGPESPGDRRRSATSEKRVQIAQSRDSNSRTVRFELCAMNSP